MPGEMSFLEITVFTLKFYIPGIFAMLFRILALGGKPLEAEKTYSLAGTDYTLRDGGDGYSMFAGCPVLEADVGLDFDALKNYLEENYTEKPSAYATPYGDGRIVAMP